MLLGGSLRYARAMQIAGMALVVLLEVNAVSGRPDLQRAVAIATGLLLLGWLGLAITWPGGHARSRDTALLILIGTGSVALVAITPQGAPIIGVIVAVVAAVARLPLAGSATYAALLGFAYIAATVHVLGWQPLPVVGDGLGIAFAFMASLSTLRLRREEARTRALLKELEATRDAQVEAAALAERSRIAREIHDILAHTLSALAVQLEGARLLLEREDASFQAREAVDRAHRLAHEGLDDTKSAVAALRGERVPGPAEIRRLVEDFRRDTGTPASFELSGTERQLEPEVGLALYRTAQEALTNIRKHSRAASVMVRLAYAEREAELEVVDSGGGPATSANGGYGLVGMRERAALLGGRLEAEPRADGFRVRLCLPA